MAFRSELYVDLGRRKRGEGNGMTHETLSPEDAVEAGFRGNW